MRAARWTAAALAGSLALAFGACGGDDDSSSSSAKSGGGGSGSGDTSPLVLANLQGSVAAGGPDFTKGVNIAVDEINAKGGVNGRKVQVKTFKMGDTPDEAVATYRDAASDDSVLTAWSGSGGATAIAGQVNREKLPLLEVSGRRDLVEPPRPYIYQLSWDKEYPSTVVRWAVENKGIRKIAILHYESDYSSGITKSIEERCKQLGCSVTTSQSAPLDASVNQLVPLLTKMKNSGADTYYIETLNPNGPKAARQLGMFDKPIISEQWLSVPAIAGATGKAGEDIVFSAQKCLKPELAAPDDPGAAWCKDYKAAYAKKYPGEPYALFSAYGHDAVEIFAQAAKQLMAAGKDVTRENLNTAYEQFDGSLQTSHGKADSSPTDHKLTGPFEQGYLLYEMKVSGDKVDYVLAPNADPNGAKP